MTSRVRKDRGPPAGSEGTSSSHDLSMLEEKRRTFIEEQQGDKRESSAGVEEVSADKLSTLYQQVDKLYEDEQRDVSKALEKLELLVAVRVDSNADLTSKRKKRKTDTVISGTSSASPPWTGTPAKERNISPVLLREDGGSGNSLSTAPIPDREKKRSNSKSNFVVGGNTVPPLQRRGTLTAKDGQNPPSSTSVPTTTNGTSKEASKDALSTSNSSGYVDPARARREVLAHQLPLQKGRKVAFRQPSKNKVGPGAANVSSMTSRSATSANATSVPTSSSSSSSQGFTTTVGGVAVPDDEGETWIMATIIECINNDRNRYVVQDAEDTAMPTYNTTLKAIVPLPESLTTLPLEDYKVGSQVMGLYPDTSCFYQAIVRGGGPGINGKLTAKMHRKADDLLKAQYLLEFEDDGGAIQNVPASLVVERP